MTDQPRVDSTARVLATVSPSKLDLFVRCQAAWTYRYVHGLKRPPSAAMAFGTAHDATANSVYTDRLQTGELPTVEQAQERFAADWDDAAADVEDWAEDDPDHLLDAGVRVTELWHRKAARHVVPHEIQPKLTRDFADGDDTFTVLGYADVVGEVGGTPTIIDQKAGRRAWTPADLIRSTQAVAYPWMTDLRRFQIHSSQIGRGTSKWTGFKVLSRTLTDADVDVFPRQVVAARRQMRALMETGDVVPNRSHFICSRRWCGYWEQCQRDFGGTVAP